LVLSKHRSDVEQKRLFGFMGNGIFRHIDPFAGVQTSFEGVPLLDELLNKFGWTRDNIGPVLKRFELEETVVRDEVGHVKYRYQVIRPSQIVRDGLTEIVSLKKLLKPRQLLPTRAIMFTSNDCDWQGQRHHPETLSEWEKILKESRGTYPGGSSGRVEFDRWYAITRIDFRELPVEDQPDSAPPVRRYCIHLADQLDVPAREYCISLKVLDNPDNIKIASGEFEACRDRARRINDWIFHKPFVW
jgi:hypothetical protein